MVGKVKIRAQVEAVGYTAFGEELKFKVHVVSNPAGGTRSAAVKNVRQSLMSTGASSPTVMRQLTKH